MREAAMLPPLRLALCCVAQIGMQARPNIAIDVTLDTAEFAADDCKSIGFGETRTADPRAERDFLQVAVDFSQQAIAVYDGDLRMLAWNQAAADIFGFPEERLQVGAPINDLIRSAAERGVYGVGATEDLIKARLEAVVDPSKPSRIRIRSASDGKTYEARPVRTKSGGWFILYVDTTAQFDSERKLEAANEELERRVRERTEELERLNAELSCAKAEAEDANLSKTRFLAAASHDLLQPLNAARLYAGSLKERIRAGDITGDSLLLAASVEASLEAVDDILTTLLDMSQLDAGVTTPEITSFHIEEVFRQLKMEFGPSATDKGLGLTFVHSSLAVSSDRRLLARLVQNLVSNAIKYTIDGRVLVGVRHEERAARIEVWDTGIGIPKAKQRDIFLEFQRLPNATRTAAGIGLGLSIVQRLARVLHHEISVRSKIGHGSVFTIRIPRAVDPPPRRGGPLQIALAKKRALEGLSIAVIDNDTAILSGMKTLLDEWGCVTTCGTDLPTIESALKTRTAPDVILADYHMSGCDGIAAVIALRKRYGSACHAALITADRSPAVRDLAHHADIRVLNKPLKLGALRSLLAQWHILKETTAA